MEHHDIEFYEDEEVLQAMVYSGKAFQGMVKMVACNDD